eukprot:CCRYP_008196-RA/>CCRYP_008196-RA protein AED:0.04 eAED:0.04 QI:673/0.5/0.4/1/0.75/0.6/5/0/634
MPTVNLASLLLLAVAPSLRTALGNLDVTFLHINDHHSHFDSNSFDLFAGSVPEGISVDTSSGVKVYFGGASYVAGAIKELADLAKSQGHEVMKIHAGDAMTGTVYYSLFGAEPDAAFMNEVGFDAFVIGNHEFDDGDGNLSEFIAQLQLPVTSYNLRPGSDSPLMSATNLHKYIIKTFDNGEQVGFCGMTPKKKTEQSSFPSPGTTIQDEVEATTACVADLQVEGVNKIVVMSHVGYDVDQEKLALIEGVDVIIGGDSHTLLGIDAAGIGGPSSSYNYATIVNGVCIVQAWEYQKVVGELTVTWDAEGNVLDCSGIAYLPFNQEKFTVINKTTGNYDLTDGGDIATMNTFLSSQPNFWPAVADQGMTDVLQVFSDQASEKMKTQIATALANMCHNRGQGGEVPVKCSSVPVQTKLGGGFLYKVPDADFAIQNAGGCRTDINEGPFSIGNAYEILPFSNTLVTLILTGSQIKSVLEDALENFLNTTIGGSTGSFPTAAGLRWTADYNKDFGNRVTNLEMNSRLQSDFWQPINMGTSYTVATNNFIALGKDGYLTFEKAGEFTDTFVNYAQSFMDFATAKVELDTPPSGWFSSQKITFLNGEVADLTTGSSPPTAPPTARPTSMPSGKAGKKSKKI